MRPSSLAAYGKIANGWPNCAASLEHLSFPVHAPVRPTCHQTRMGALTSDHPKAYICDHSKACPRCDRMPRTLHSWLRVRRTSAHSTSAQPTDADACDLRAVCTTDVLRGLPPAVPQAISWHACASPCAAHTARGPRPVPAAAPPRGDEALFVGAASLDGARRSDGSPLAHGSASLGRCLLRALPP